MSAAIQENIEERKKMHCGEAGMKKTSKGMTLLFMFPGLTTQPSGAALTGRDAPVFPNDNKRHRH